jgi:hypothetical protein
MEFHPSQWLEILAKYPVISVLLGGAVGGMCLTQILKQVYFALPIRTLSDARYTALVLVVTVIVTFLFTNELWETVIGDHGSGLRHVVSLASACTAPYAYKGLRIVIAWKWPGLAAKLGGNDLEPTPPK